MCLQYIYNVNNKTVLLLLLVQGRYTSQEACASSAYAPSQDRALRSVKNIFYQQMSG